MMTNTNHILNNHMSKDQCHANSYYQT